MGSLLFAKPLVIKVGQPLADAIKSLDDRKIEYGEGQFAFAATKNRKNMSFHLDVERLQVVVFYAPSTQSISGISILITASSRTQKLHQTWMVAEDVTLHDDGSYSIHFAAPVK